jgi:hypothetical protein
LTEAPDLVAGLWRPLYVEWRNYAINYAKRPIVKKHHQCFYDFFCAYFCQIYLVHKVLLLLYC